MSSLENLTERGIWQSSKQFKLQKSPPCGILFPIVKIIGEFPAWHPYDGSAEVLILHLRPASQVTHTWHIWLWSSVGEVKLQFTCVLWSMTSNQPGNGSRVSRCHQSTDHQHLQTQAFACTVFDFRPHVQREMLYLVSWWCHIDHKNGPQGFLLSLVYFLSCLLTKQESCSLIQSTSWKSMYLDLLKQHSIWAE